MRMYKEGGVWERDYAGPGYRSMSTRPFPSLRVRSGNETSTKAESTMFMNRSGAAVRSVPIKARHLRKARTSTHAHFRVNEPRNITRSLNTALPQTPQYDGVTIYIAIL